MYIKSILSGTCLVILAALTTACSAGGDGAQGAGGASVSEQQKQEAVNKGRTAARALINVNESDSFGIQGKLLEARAMQSQYVTDGRKVEAEIFDTAFIHTLRAVKPELARQIEANN